MSGVPTPEIIVEAWAINAGAPYITDPIPVPSQIPISSGAASWTDGFPPVCFLSPGAGGQLPSGKDFNGVLKMISAYCAAMQAGQYPAYDVNASTAFAGYALGAVLQKADGSGTWRSTVAGNVTDPDTGGAGWVSSVPLYSAVALTGLDDVVLPGPSDYVIAVNTGAGALTYTGFVAQRDGQRLVFVCAGANNLSFTPLTGSAAGNQIRMSAALSVVQNDSFTLQYSAGNGKWLAV